jgi:hypothetical protein
MESNSKWKESMVMGATVGTQMLGVTQMGTQMGTQRQVNREEVMAVANQTSNKKTLRKSNPIIEMPPFEVTKRPSNPSKLNYEDIPIATLNTMKRKQKE